MSLIDSFLDLPIELACELVGRWLSLNDVAFLDTAYCEKLKRQVLHESVFHSSNLARVIASLPD